MFHRWLTLLALFAATPAAAQVAPAVAPPVEDATRMIRLGLTRLPPLVPVDFQLPPLEDVLLTRMRFDDWVAGFTTRVARSVAAGRDSSRAQRGLARAPAITDTVPFLPPLPVPDTAVGEDELIGGLVGQYADIGMRVTGLGELGGSWTRYNPCDPSLYLNCNPGYFPQIEPDVEFGVLVGGTISDRIHVNVDYDQRREDFSAANNINVFYQGLPDEILQRVEVGDVSIRLPGSRYLTRGIPAGNFGLMASGQLGPLDFQTVWAQQRGDVTTREFRLASGGAEGLVQDDRIVLDDADYSEGQFFFLVDPFTLQGAPHVDVLALQATDAPPTVRPAQGGTIQIYRDERAAIASGPQQAQLGLFLADAVSADGTLKHPGQFRRLVPDEDYIVHASGLWIMLRSPLRNDESLAVAYVTESGETVGTVDPESAPPGTTPVLRLLRSPVATHQPGRPTWDYEMHQVYRLNASSDVELQSIDMTVSLGDEAGGQTFVNANGAQITFLKLFGLDEDAPADLIDNAQIFQPGRGIDPQAGGGRINGTFIVFPTLQPFLDPPPVPSAGLTADQAKAVLGADGNDIIYTNPDPVLRNGGTRYRLNFTYRVRVEGLVSSFNLGQFGIREGTERIAFGGRTLERDVDYTIDYEIGQVTLSDPASLFGANPASELRATWEQKSLFQIAPTSVFGANARYSLGALGELNFVGIYQSEQTLYSRPQVGVEPGAIFLGGASASFDLGAAWMDRLLERVPGLRLTAPSAVSLDGELAFSLPNPNRHGQAYLDDFEGTDEIGLDVRRQQWKLGSSPGTTDGDDGVLPFPLTADNAARLVWQHDNADRKSNFNPRQEIDNQIQIAGNELPEPVMWLTFADADTPPGERVWRSMTTVLSTTGRDMTRSEYLEFYVSAGGTEPLALVFDIGTVGEDAFYVDSLRNTNGSYSDGVPWGLGVLDQEASLALREVWGPDKDARGLWDQPCISEPLTAYPLGDARANCTRGNGVNDTEDLDGNGILDADDAAYFRYVVHLDRLSQYLVRNTDETGTLFRLYRIPLRTGTGVPVNGANDGTWRFIKHLRITLAGEPAGVKNLILARLRIVGSRWTKRDIHGVVHGLLGDTASVVGGGADVTVGPVSRLTDGSDYSPPPGVREQVQDPTAQYGVGGIEFNEKSQRIRYTGLEPDERAEIYLRYPQEPRNFLTYRQLRMWAVARVGDWGPNGSQRLLMKLGTDPRNYYLFQTRLAPATGDRPVTPADWLPEIRLDVGQWLQLKALAEEELIRTPPGQQVVLWSPDSSYALVLEDRARAPNLAAVRELTFAVYNDGPTAATGEVWIDDLRLDEPDQQPGMAGNVSLSITSDFLTATIGYANRGALFRQLNEDPTYQRAGDLSIATRARLDRFLPASWGVELPLTVTHTRASSDPLFLERSDVRADRLDGLRETGADLTRVGLTLGKRTPTANPFIGLLVNGLTLRMGWNSASTNAITNRNEASGLDGGIDWRLDLARRDFDVVPGFLESFLRAIAPAALENSDAYQRLLGARLRWTPDVVGFGTSYFDQETRAFRYNSILADAADDSIAPIESPRHGLDNSAQIGVAPFDALTASLNVRSSRDLLDPERASNQPFEQDALRRARGGIAGTDLGWETNRSLTSSFAFRPRIANWIRPSYTYSNRFNTSRNPGYLEFTELGADSIAEMQRRFGSDKQISRRIDMQPNELFRMFSSDSSGGMLYRLGQAFRTLSLTWNSGVGSQFERETFQPGAGYQLGLGGFERFRFLDDDTSASALARDDIRLNSGIGLPLNGVLTLTYSQTGSESFDARGGRRTQDQTGWPNIRLDWRQVPVPTALQRFILAASIGGGYEHVERSSLYGTNQAQQRGGEEDRYPVEVTLTLGSGITTAYTATLANGTSNDPTGNAEQERMNHALRFTGSFPAPAFLGEKFTSPFLTRLSLSQDGQRQCRFTPAFGSAQPTCVPFLDLTTRSANFSLETLLSDLTVGLRLDYTSRQNAVGTRTGSSQFSLALFGQFNFTAGQMGSIQPGLPGGIR